MILVVAGYAYLRVTEEREQRRIEFDRRVDVTTRAIRLAVERDLRSGTLADIDQLARDLVLKQTEILRVRLLDRQLATRVDANLLAGDPGVPFERLREVRDGSQSAVVERRVQGLRLHSVLLPVRPLTTDEGVLEVTYGAGRLEADLLSENHRSALSTAALVILLGLLAWFALERLVLRPVVDLGQALERVSLGDFRASVPVRSRDELGKVAAVFNRMTKRLEQARHQVETETDRSLELMRRLRLSESLAAAGKLSSSIAHEVGTPLNIIAGRAELMLHTLPADSPLREDLGIITNQIDRISRMIRAALDPFHPREPEPVGTELRTVTDGLRPLLQHFARGRGVKLATVVPIDLPAIFVDPGHLQQVLINLLTNAIEATPAGGLVEVTAALRVQDQQAGVAIAVRDTGPGIPEAVLPRIFDPFFSTKPEHGGTGLGLSICRDLVKSNGSDIQVTTTPGEGTVFTVWFPVARSDGGKEQS
jgi:signal transduction histidine kinase